MFEELNQGLPEDDEPRGPNRLAWTVAAVGCVLAGVVFILFRTDAESVSAPPPRTPSVGPNAGPREGPGLAQEPGLTLITNPEQKLGLGRICQSVNGGRTLAISFNLVNISSTEITLIDVEPLLPRGGLRRSGPNTAGGTCEHPGREAPGGLLAPGDIQLITMRFRLPKQCPQPSPVPAQVALRVNQMVGTTTVPVRSKIGAVAFDSCPDPE